MEQLLTTRDLDDPGTGELTYYGSSTNTLDVSVKFLYTYEGLSDENINGTWSIQWDNINPIETLDLNNPLFKTCDKSAYFCAYVDDNGKFKIGRDIEAQRNPGDIPKKCRKLALVIEWVDAADLVSEQGDNDNHCPARSTFLKTAHRLGAMD